MTKSYHELEKSTYDTVREHRFTRILSKPTWQQKEDLIQEASDIAVEMEVTYDWADDFGLLAMVIGDTRYLAETTLNYVAPIKPTD